jgi:SAM-dependent methyltransferase
MDFYASVGRECALRNEDVLTKETLLAQERAEPNSILDAQRLVATTAELLAQTSTPKAKFLDIGCGYGLFSKEAIDRGFQVTALDLASNKRKVTQEITGLDPVQSSFENFDCAPSSFSAILMSQILEHVSDVNLWISKAHRSLTDNGVLAIGLPNFGCAARFILREKSPYITPPEHLNFFSPPSLSALLQKHGFQVERVQWISRVPKRLLKKRLPKVAAPLLPVVDLMARVSLRACDALHLGLMINLYGRKVARRSPAKTEA